MYVSFAGRYYSTFSSCFHVCRVRWVGEWVGGWISLSLARARALSLSLARSNSRSLSLSLSLPLARSFARARARARSLSVGTAMEALPVSQERHARTLLAKQLHYQVSFAVC